MSANKFAACNSPASNCCAACKAIWYCGANCQAADWNIHKQVCREYTTFIATGARPADTVNTVYKLGIYFPTDSERPKFNWMKMEVRSANAPRDMWQSVDMSYVGSLSEAAPWYLNHGIDTSGQEFKLSRFLEFWYRDRFLYDGSEKNNSVRKLLKSAYTGQWRGPIMLLRRDDARIKPQDRYEDVKLEDLTHAIYYLKNPTPSRTTITINPPQAWGGYLSNQIGIVRYFQKNFSRGHWMEMGIWGTSQYIRNVRTSTQAGKAKFSPTREHPDRPCTVCGTTMIIKSHQDTLLLFSYYPILVMKSYTQNKTNQFINALELFKKVK